MRVVVRTNKWHSVEVRVRRVHAADGGKEIRLAADQEARWNGTHLTPESARALAKALVLAANVQERKGEAMTITDKQLAEWQALSIKADRAGLLWSVADQLAFAVRGRTAIPALIAEVRRLSEVEIT